MINSTLEQLRDPAYWKVKLGLLPVPMYGQENEQGYVLLNGAIGNFCLQAEGDPVDDPRSLAWSSDVGHFLTIKNQQVRVLSWQDQSSFETSYGLSEVNQNLAEFHAYLEKREPNRDASVVAHALRVLGQLRPLLPYDATPTNTIEHFLHLLALGIDKTAPPDMRQLLENEHEFFTLKNDMLSSSDWDMLQHELTRDRPLTALKPLVSLMLRHSSGNLFQDVHYQIQIPFNHELPGIAPAPARISSRQQNKVSGVYFTPPFIARTLVEESLRVLGTQLPDVLRVFDPACGSSEFFKELIRQLNLIGYKGTLQITGWDISEVALKISRFTLEFEKQLNTKFKIEYDIQLRDAILASLDDWPNDVAIVIMNPPYAAWQFLDEKYRTRLTEIFGKGRPNLAAAFSNLAMKCIAKNGVFAAVLPAAVTEASSAEDWREYASQSFSPRLIAKLGSQSLFLNAMVDANLVILVNEAQGRLPCRVIWADHKKTSTYKALRSLRSLSAAEITSEIISTQDYSVYTDYHLGRNKASWRPCSYDLLNLLNQYSNLPKLGEIFDVKQGARTGDDIFIQPASYIKSLREEEARFFRPAVINDSIDQCKLSADWYAWFPYGVDLPKIDSEQHLSQLIPTYFSEKLVNCKLRTASGNSRLRENLGWWDLIWPRQWQFEKSKKIVSKYFGEEGSFAYDQSGDFVVIVGHAWIPMKTYAASFDDDLAYAYIAITASKHFGRLLEAVSTHIGGGQLKLEKQYLKHLPLPWLGKGTFVSISTVRDLISAGMKLSKGGGIEIGYLDELVIEAYNM